MRAGAGYPAKPTKGKALAVWITKRNLDFLGVDDSGKKAILEHIGIRHNM